MRYLLLVLLTVTATVTRAQKISGLAKEEGGSVSKGLAVSLVKANDSAVVKLALTNNDGVYYFEGIKTGNYKIIINTPGYNRVISPAFAFGNADVVVAEITVSRLPTNLNKVTVVAQKPMVEVKAEKTILNVEGTVNAVGINALELLRKSPGVLLDKDDNISMAGKNGVQVYIDGRTTPLSGADLANYLKTLQSALVESIELITNPSAKYDAAGNAGIINIRLKKNKALGTNGSVNAGWNMGVTAKYNLGASLNYRNTKLNIFTNYSYGYTPNRQHLNLVRSVLDTIFDQHSTIYDLRKGHNIKAGADYFLNKKNILGVMVNGIINDPSSSSDGKTYISASKTNTIDRILVASNSNKMKRQNLNINLNYSYTGKKGNSLGVNADRGSYQLRNDQFQPNVYYDASGQTAINSVIYHMIAPADIGIRSVKADYEQPYKKGKLGFGFKSARINTDNNFQRYNVGSSGEELDKDRSNHFKYNENINAGYLSFNRQYKKLMFQAGMRVEHTVTEGISNSYKFNGTNSSAGASVFNRSYTDFFPSASLSFNKNKLKQWGLSFSRRIDRPAYQDLNPFEFKLDEYTFMKGNINLRPQYTNSFGINYTYKYKLNATLNYSHVKDLFTQILDTTEKSKAFVSKKNLATQDVINLSLSYPYQHKAYSLFTSINSNYSKYKADFGTGRKVDLDAVGFTIFMQHSLRFAKTWTGEISGFYNSPTIYQGSFKARSVYSMDGGLSKQFLNGKALVKTSVSDVFHTLKFRAKSDFAGQITSFRFQGESQQFKLNLTYKFGSNKVKPARQRITGSEEEAKRTLQGSGMLGN